MEESNLFGMRLKEKRKENKLTQKELAELVGAKHNSVCDWEKGRNKPDPDTIERICEVLNISASYLLPSKRRVNMTEPETQILYVSISSGDVTTDEIRKQLHDWIDQLDEEDLRLVSGFSLKFKV